MTPFLRGLKLEALGDMVIIGGLTAAGYFAQSLGLEHGNAATSAFLCSMAVVTCPMLDRLNGKQVGHAAWRAVALAIAGAAVLELGGAAPPTASDAWALVQPLAFGAGFWWTEQSMKRHPEQGAQFSAVQIMTVGALSSLWALADGASKGLDAGALLATVAEGVHNPEVVVALLWTGLVTTALTVWLEVRALGALSSAETTVLFSTEPLWGAAFAHAMLAERIGPETFLGGALILAACASRAVKPAELAARARASWDEAGAHGRVAAGHALAVWGGLGAALQRAGEDLGA
jgi:drug/metabolite transporter (DMT)-like permease